MRRIARLASPPLVVLLIGTLAGMVAPSQARAATSPAWSVSPTLITDLNTTITVRGTGCVVPGVASSSLSVVTEVLAVDGTWGGEGAQIGVTAAGDWSWTLPAVYGPSADPDFTISATCWNFATAATAVFVYSPTYTVTYKLQAPPFHLSLSTPIQSCRIPCNLSWTARLTDAAGRGVPGVNVFVRIWIPDPTWAPDGGTGDVELVGGPGTARLTAADGTVTFSYKSARMRGVRISAFGDVNLSSGASYGVATQNGAGYYVEPGRRPSVGLLLISPGDGGSPYGSCTASVVRSGADAASGNVLYKASTLLTAGHCAVAKRYWFYPGAVNCDFSTVSTTRSSNSDPRCAPLGIWPATLNAGKVTASCCNGVAEDFGFVSLDRDPLSGATVNQAVPGLDIEFNHPLKGRWQAWGRDGSGFQLCRIRNPSTAGSGSGMYWQAHCPTFGSGDSGGPWGDLASGFSVGAVASKVGIFGAPLTTAALDLYRSLP